MHGDGAVAPGVVDLVPPHRLEQLPGAHHLPLPLQQGAQDGELRGGEVQRPAPQGALVGPHVHLQLPAGQNPAAPLGLGGVVPLVPPQLGLHPGHQLQGPEGLGEVVVRPQGEAGDLVRLPVPGGEHDDGIVLPLVPNAPAQLVPVHAGEHQVQDGQVQGCAPDAGQGLPGRVALAHLIALVFQVHLHQVGDLLLVVHHQNPVRHRPVLSPGSSPANRL